MGKKIVYQLNHQNNSQYAENKRVRTNKNTTKFPYQPSDDMGNNKTKYTSLYEFFSKFPNEESARKYFELKDGMVMSVVPTVVDITLPNVRIKNRCPIAVGIVESSSASDLVQF